MSTTILAVDDSATMRKALEITFAGTEFQVVTCDSGARALEKVKTDGPSLVIVDVSLPPGDGYELCTTLKLAAPNLPVLMLSSKHNPFDAAKGAQADGHLDKPFDTQALQDKVRELVAGAGAPRAAAAAAAPAKPPAAAASQPEAARAPAAAAQKARPAAAIVGGAAARPVAAATTRIGPFAPPAGAAAPSSAAGGPSFKDTMPMPGRGVQDAAAQARAGVAAGRPGAAAARAAVGSASRAAAPSRPGARPGEPLPAADDELTRSRPAGTLPGIPIAAAAQGGVRKIAETPTPPAAAAVKPAAAKEAEPVAAAAAAAAAGLEDKLQGLGLSPEQVQGVLALSRDVVERVVWEVVPVLAETIIKEEIKRLTAEG